MNPSDVRLILTRHCPEFLIETITGPSAGTSNECFEIDDRWIFRFPKDQESACELQKEILVLEHVRSRLPCQVPGHQIIQPTSSEFPYIYVGYRRIPGRPLFPESLADFGRPQRKALATDLGVFLSSLHQTPLSDLEEQAESAGLNLFDSPFVHQSWIGGQTTKSRLVEMLHLLRSDSKHSRLLEVCEPYFDEPALFDDDLCLVHGDISEHHLLYEPQSGRLLGVIDFGNVKIDDSWSDFLNMLHCYDLRFCLEVLESYSRPSAPLIQHKLEFYERVRREPGDFLQKLLVAGNP